MRVDIGGNTIKSEDVCAVTYVYESFACYYFTIYLKSGQTLETKLESKEETEKTRKAFVDLVFT